MPTQWSLVICGFGIFSWYNETYEGQLYVQIWLTLVSYVDIILFIFSDGILCKIKFVLRSLFRILNDNLQLNWNLKFRVMTSLEPF